ncbi:hypothetical protein DRQ25_00965 [Candidatus Fermentibacteria bacterium]|nr:MAG: hypothetical protein DRQ25_00965 [Candidatus Fermentibacteria bacterium]
MPKLKKYKVILDGKECLVEKGQKLHASIPVKVKSIDKENHSLTMVASTQDVDRQGDTVIQDGWDLKPFKKNPVILNSHNYNDATEVIARAENPRVEGKGKKSKLIMDWIFAVEENPKAKVIFDLYAGKFLHASSVGFIPRKFAEDKEGNKDWWTIEEAELLEVSAVSVPANARSLAKSKGIDVDILKNKDESYADDEIPEGDKVPSTDGEEPTGDDDDSDKDGEDEDIEDVEPDAGDGDGEEVDTGEDDAEDDEPEPVEEKKIEKKRFSYRQKVVKAIKRIETKKAKKLKSIARIIKSLIDDEIPGGNLENKTKEQVRKRKINQAIRSLNKIK